MVLREAVPYFVRKTTLQAEVVHRDSRRFQVDPLIGRALRTVLQ